MRLTSVHVHRHLLPARYASVLARVRAPRYLSRDMASQGAISWIRAGDEFEIIAGVLYPTRPGCRHVRVSCCTYIPAAHFSLNILHRFGGWLTPEESPLLRLFYALSRAGRVVLVGWDWVSASGNAITCGSSRVTCDEMLLLPDGVSIKGDTGEAVVDSPTPCLNGPTEVIGTSCSVQGREWRCWIFGKGRGAVRFYTRKLRRGVGDGNAGYAVVCRGLAQGWIYSEEGSIIFFNAVFRYSGKTTCMLQKLVLWLPLRHRQLKIGIKV